MAALNIKNEEVVRLVKQLADREGKSLTAVVREAVEESLQRDRAKEQRDGLAHKLLEIGRSTAPLWVEPALSIRHGDLLYDEYGLPM